MADAPLCVEFPEVSADLNITLPFGELKAFRDISLGLPTDCSMTFNLLVQIQPLLASMACLLKVLNVVGKLKEFFDAVPNPVEMGQAAPKVIGAITELGPCLPPGIFVSLALTVKGILQVIISFLSCLIEQIESVLNFQLSIDFSIAEGNPILQASLSCAADNAQRSMDHLMASIGPIGPLMDTLKMIGDIISVPLTLPDFSQLTAAGADVAQTISSLRATIDQLQQTLDAIPG